MVLTFTEVFATSYIGQEAAFTPMEKSLFLLSLPKALENLSKEAVDQTNQVLFPLILVAAVALYSGRIYSLYKVKRLKELAEQQTKERAVEQEINNHSQNVNGAKPTLTRPVENIWDNRDIDRSNELRQI